MPDQAKSKLASIANGSLGIKTLETRHSDQDDFHEVSARGMKDALEGAFKAGGNSKVNNKAIAKIASERLGIPTLESRQSDQDDFHEVSVWSTRMALEAAYKAGGGK